MSQFYSTLHQNLVEVTVPPAAAAPRHSAPRIPASTPPTTGNLGCRGL